MVENRNGKKVLITPVTAEDLADIHIGDIVYLDGDLVTCRDVAHRRLIEGKRELPVDLHGKAILHAGPIVHPSETAASGYEMVSVGPTTSMHMEKFEKEFVEQTGVKVIVGKGGMGPNTEYACKTFKAIHCVFPAGCAVVAATEVQRIAAHHWDELGMPETLWCCDVKEFGSLIVSIDADGRNLFEENKVIFNQKKRRRRPGDLQTRQLHQIIKIVEIAPPFPRFLIRILAPSQSRSALCGLIRLSSVLFAGEGLRPGVDVRAVFGVVAAELEEIDVALRHIGFDCLGIAGAELPVAVQKRLQLGLGPQEFLSRPPEHCPGDIEFPVSVSGKLKIQNAADMMPFPEDIRIVKIPMAKTRVGRFLCGWKKPLEVLQLQRFQYRIRRRVKEFSVLYALCLNIQLMDSG